MLVLVHPSPMTSAKELAGALQIFGAARAQDGLVVLETTRVQEIAGMFGVAKASVAIECESQFSPILKAIVQAGKRTVLQGQSFFVKVSLTQARDFAARDLEFAATGALAAELAGVSSPARSEDEAGAKTIAAYVGKGRRAFVALREYEGAGGALAGSLGMASCTLTGPLSLASCVAACRAGFSLPEPLLLYSDEDDLCRNAKLARSLAEKTGAKKQKIAIAKVRAKGGKAKTVQLDLVAARTLAGMKGSRYVVLPLSLATHPQWFIEMATKEVHDAGKVLLAPMMFSEMGASEERAEKVTRREFMKLKTVSENPRRLSLEVGPNYLHDIIDSV